MVQCSLKWSGNMKRFHLGLLILVLIVSLTGCITEEVPLTLDDEFNRIHELLPKSFDDDVVLPSVTEGFTVRYTILEAEIEDHVLVFEQKEADEFIPLTITLTKEAESKEFTILLTQLGDLASYQEYLLNKVLDEVESKIDTMIPSTLTSNITLEDVSNLDAEVNYGTTCGTIEQNRLVYSYPEETTSCTFSATVRYQGNTKVLEYEYDMLGIDDLPKIPRIYINTSQSAEIDSDKDYTTSSLSLVNYDDSSDNFNDALIGIRLRGNSTYHVDKKSYKIKFDEKTALLSDYKEKDWVLLANHMDQTLVRTYLAFQLSNSLDMAFTPSTTFIDLYINGEYQGNYLLTDQVEVTNDRVDIEENEPTIDTGFLLEYDRRAPENNENFFWSNGIPFVVKSPDIDDDHYSNSQKEFISDYMDSVFYAIKNKLDYSSLIDEASFIDWFIVNEVFKNVDSGFSSVYYYKDAGELLKMGPVWDFDLSSGNYGHLGSSLRGPTGWYTSRSDKNKLFYYLMKYDSFKSSLKERWNELYDEVLLELPNNVLLASDSITASQYHNFLLWDIIGKEDEWYTSPELLVLESYQEQVWFLHDFLETRIEWLNKSINQFN